MGVTLWISLKGAKTGNLDFGNSILSSLAALFADTFGLPSSTGSTMIFFPATARLEVGSVFTQTEGRMPGAKLTHTASWSASVFIGVFPSQPSPNLDILLIKSDKSSAWGGRIAGKLFPCPATPDSVRNRACKTSKNPHLWLCGNVNTTATP